MDNEDLEARIAAKRTKKKGSSSKTKSSKKKGDSSTSIEQRIKDKQRGDGGGSDDDGGGKPSASSKEGSKKKKSKKKKDPDTEAAIQGWEEDVQAKNAAAASSTAHDEDAPTDRDRASAAKAKEEDEHDEYMDNQRSKYEDEENGFGVVAVDDDAEVYYPNIEADTEIMAEINQEGLVTVDESGGITAFVAETIEICGDDVGVIRSDAEIEKEEKTKYTKFFLGSVACIVVVIVAIAVPLTLKFAKGNQKNVLNIVTLEPTSTPSMVPSAAPSSMPSSEKFRDVVKKLTPISGDALYVQGSPQYKAAMWISDQDERNLDLDDPGFEQRYIMAVFYFAMDGNMWENNNGWLGPDSECFWFGIEGVSEGCGSDESGGCIKRSDFVGDYDKVCRIAMGELLVGVFSSVSFKHCGSAWNGKWSFFIIQELRFLSHLQHITCPPFIFVSIRLCKQSIWRIPKRIRIFN